MAYLNQNAASARLVASVNRFNAFACMFIQCCSTHDLVSGYLLQSGALRRLAAGIQIHQGARAHGPSSAPNAAPMPLAIHLTRSSCLILSFHPECWPVSGYPAGSGPHCVEPPRPQPPPLLQPALRRPRPQV